MTTTHIEKVAVELLRDAPVNSYELHQYREEVCRDPLFAHDMPGLSQNMGDAPIDPEWAKRNGNPLPRIARMEQRATYLLANAICYYRLTRARQGVPDEPSREDTLLNEIKHYHDALEAKHREEVWILRNA